MPNLIGPVDDLLLYILKNPEVFIACTIAAILVVIGGFSFYGFSLTASEKRLEESKTEEYLKLLKRARENDSYIHGEETAAGLLQEWEESIQDNTSGKRGLIRLKKFNLKAETFLRKRGYL